MLRLDYVDMFVNPHFKHHMLKGIAWEVRLFAYLSTWGVLGILGTQSLYIMILYLLILDAVRPFADDGFNSVTRALWCARM